MPNSEGRRSDLWEESESKASESPFFSFFSPFFNLLAQIPSCRLQGILCLL